MNTFKKITITSLALLLCACSASNSAATTTPGSGSGSSATEAAEIPDPYINYASLEEAEDAVGFEITLPEEIDKAEPQQYRVMDDIMLEVIYEDEDGYQVARIRKEATADDISGDYNVYELDDEVEQEGITYRLRGSGDVYYLGTWTSGDYSYAVSDYNGADQAGYMNLISQVG